MFKQLLGHPKVKLTPKINRHKCIRNGMVNVPYFASHDPTTGFPGNKL